MHNDNLVLLLIHTNILFFSLPRIERLWRDVFGGVLDLFYTTFCYLEMEGLLHTDNEMHMYALHWTFLPHINRHLQFFKDGWNNHRLRTEGNQSPLQIWSQNEREGHDPGQVSFINAISQSKIVCVHYFVKTPVFNSGFIYIML